MSVAVASFAVFAASQVGTPGPANMALMTTGARFGLRAALPFVAGVILGKQLVIWPVGFGLLELGQRAPFLFEALKYLCALYIFWLAWRIATTRLGTVGEATDAPGFLAGLAVHPLNPKAWAMITGGFTAFVTPGTSALTATVTIAGVLLFCQLFLHPLWTVSGEGIARHLAGTAAEPYMMATLAGLTVVSVVFVLFGGGT